MEKLFIKSENKMTPIEPAIVKKYNLEKGVISPYTRSPVVGEHGEFPSETSVEKDPKNTGGKGIRSSDTENVMLSTSEIIDFAQASDSSTGG